MNATRLLILADALEKRDTFDSNGIRFFFGDVVDGTAESTHRLSCGSTACAIGIMPLVPEFAALGVRYGGPDRGFVEVICDGLPADDLRSYSFRTASHVFDLTEDECSYLFAPYGGSLLLHNLLPVDASATDVAAHIRSFVAGGGMPQ